MWKILTFLISALLLVSADISFSKPINEMWMEIYSDNSKVGYTYRKISERKNSTIIKEETVLNLKLLGSETEMIIDSEYTVENGKISSFLYDVSSSSIGLKLKGNFKGKKLTIVDLGNDRTQEFILKHDYIVPSLLPDYVYGKGLKKGSSFEVFLFDPVNIYAGYNPDLLKAHVIVHGSERVDVSSGNITATKVSIDFIGAENTIWITGEGVTVLEKFEPSLTAVLSSKEKALKKNNKAFNITEKTSIVSNRYIHNPRDLKKMVVLLSGLENFDGLNLNDGNYQSFSNKVVTVNRPEITNLYPYELPYNGNIPGEYLEATSLIQSDNPEIINQAEKILNKENNPVLAVKLINDWLYKNIEKIPTVSIPSAVDVLKTLEGDCNEHAVLFAALTRAAGIPVKVVLGVVYLEGRFYYHAWNEVYIGNWVPVDSTFGQMPVDATHLKLIEGDISKSPEILKVVGKMRIEVIETN